MPRRDFASTQKGQVYCIEWPEWHVECACCEARCHVSGLGETATAREADKRLRNGDIVDADPPGKWRRIRGLWHCPHCAEEHDQ